MRLFPFEVVRASKRVGVVPGVEESTFTTTGPFKGAVGIALLMRAADIGSASPTSLASDWSYVGPTTIIVSILAANLVCDLTSALALAFALVLASRRAFLLAFTLEKSI